jgi:hypothetical protein
LFWSYCAAQIWKALRGNIASLQPPLPHGATVSWPGGEIGLKSRETDVEDEERRRLKSVVASVSVENELLREKIVRMENGRPFAFWKSKP